MPADKTLTAMPLGTIARGDKTELRLELACFGDGPKFVSARLWERWGEDNNWHPSRKGITFRRGELPTILEALKRAIEATS